MGMDDKTDGMDEGIVALKDNVTGMDERVRDLLDELRNRIDAIDRTLVHQLEERMAVVSRIADVKAKYGVAVLDEGREAQVRRNIRNAMREAALEPYLLRMIDDIMAASRAYQQDRLSHKPAKPAALSPIKLGLLGRKLSHSRSPEIHDAWFRLHGQQGSYTLLEREPEALEALLPNLRAQGYAGINVTIPYKTAIMRHLDEISPEARRIGAVNTIRIDERLIGDNTDYAGFGRLVRSLLPTQTPRHVAVLGTGGSCRAVLAWLEDNGAETITLVSRDPEEAAMKWPGLATSSYEAFRGEGLDLIVNTTPVGMHPHPDASPLQPAQLACAGSVIDLIYNPLQTRLLAQAAALGIPHANGLTMLVAQAVEAQAIWQDVPYDPNVTAAILSQMA